MLQTETGTPPERAYSQVTSVALFVVPALAGIDHETQLNSA